MALCDGLYSLFFIFFWRSCLGLCSKLVAVAILEVGSNCYILFPVSYSLSCILCSSIGLLSFELTLALFDNVQRTWINRSLVPYGWPCAMGLDAKLPGVRFFLKKWEIVY